MTTKKSPCRANGCGAAMTTPESYPRDGRLSMAGEILLLIEQAPEHADRLRGACWRTLETTLRRYYAERGHI